MTGVWLLGLMAWIATAQVVAVGRDHHVPWSPRVRALTAVLLAATAVATLPRLIDLVT